MRIGINFKVVVTFSILTIFTVTMFTLNINFKYSKSPSGVSVNKDIDEAKKNKDVEKKIIIYKPKLDLKNLAKEVSKINNEQNVKMLVDLKKLLNNRDKEIVRKLFSLAREIKYLKKSLKHNRELINKSNSKLKQEILDLADMGRSKFGDGRKQRHINQIYNLVDSVYKRSRKNSDSLKKLVENYTDIRGELNHFSNKADVIADNINFLMLNKKVDAYQFLKNLVVKYKALRPKSFLRLKIKYDRRYIRVNCRYSSFYKRVEITFRGHELYITNSGKYKIEMIDEDDVTLRTKHITVDILEQLMNDGFVGRILEVKPVIVK